jgi:hypothetical protein
VYLFHSSCISHLWSDSKAACALQQVAYLNFERQRLPDELMKAEVLKHTGIEHDRQDVEVQVSTVIWSG